MGAGGRQGCHGSLPEKGVPWCLVPQEREKLSYAGEEAG